MLLRASSTALGDEVDTRVAVGEAGGPPQMIVRTAGAASGIGLASGSESVAETRLD